MWAYCGSSQRKELLSEQQKGIGCPNFHLLWCILHGYPKDISRGSILSVKSPLNLNFWTPFPFHSRRDNPFQLTGTGMENCIPKFWEREREWKIAFPTFGNGNGNDKFHSQFLGTGTGMTNSIPNFREREWDVVIPGNDREREREWPQKIGSNFIFCRKDKRRLLYQISSQTYH